MNLTSRPAGLLRCILVVAGLLVSALAAAQGPSGKPIRIVVPFGPGGSGDITARAFGQYLESVSKQPVVIENKAGANGILGTEMVKNAAPDGHTLLLTTNTTLAANLSLYRKVPYEPLKDFDHVGMFGTAASVALVLKGSGINTIADLVSHAKANPGVLAYGSWGSGSSGHLAMEGIKAHFGIDMPNVPYQGTAALLNALLGNNISVAFTDIAASVAAHLGVPNPGPGRSFL